MSLCSRISLHIQYREQIVITRDTCNCVFSFETTDSFISCNKGTNSKPINIYKNTSVTLIVKRRVCTWYDPGDPDMLHTSNNCTKCKALVLGGVYVSHICWFGYIFLPYFGEKSLAAHNAPSLFRTPYTFAERYMILHFFNTYDSTRHTYQCVPFLSFFFLIWNILTENSFRNKSGGNATTISMSCIEITSERNMLKIE